MALPQILAGPIVRRVDRETAAFWIALSAEAKITASVWAGAQQSTSGGNVASGDAPVATGEVRTRKFGTGLHVAVVTAKVTGPGVLNPGQIHSYDLVCSEGSITGGLRELGMLRDQDPPAAGNAPVPDNQRLPLRLALGYGENELPSFVTPPPVLPDLCLAQASCRKTNGSGPDALAWLDEEIRDNVSDPVSRPQQLFLTGDQIYADEVGACLLPMLNALGTELMGHTEQLQVGSAVVDASLAKLPAMRRQRLVSEMARFSTTSGANHLLSFGEYAAMYLAVWSPSVWRPLAEADQVLVPVPQAELDALHLTDWAKDQGDTTFGDWKAAATKKFEAESARVREFRDAVPRVARALANVSTYMIFDDHEVTDDWNLSRSWRTRTVTAPLGRAVLRNALCAYTVFQGWGNDPAAFTHAAGGVATANELVLDQLSQYAQNAAAPEAVRNKLEELLGLAPPGGDAQATFHYSVPGPRHMVRVLDTRTRRRYSGGGNGPPKLLGDSVEQQLPAGPLTDGRELLVLVSAAPLLFPRLVDVLVQPAAAQWFDFAGTVSGQETPADGSKPPPRVIGTENWDVEGWHSDEVHHETFLRRAATYRRVVVLSGDVHFGSGLMLDRWGAGDNILGARIVQLTSSAARNQPSASQRAVLRAVRFAKTLMTGEPFEWFSWNDKPAVQVPPGAAVRPGRRARLRRKPGIVPAADWPAGTTIADGKPPDHRWRLTALRDERPREQLPFGAPALPVLPAFNAADPLVSYQLIAGVHTQAAFARSEPVRSLVFRSNVGLVRFLAQGPDGIAVRHELLSPADEAGGTGGPFTEHTAPFEPVPAPAPPQLRTK